MILEIINWVGSIIAILGTIELAKKKPAVLLVNTLYFISNILLLIIFGIRGNYAMVLQYLTFIVISGIGIKNGRKIIIENEE